MFNHSATLLAKQCLHQQRKEVHAADSHASACHDACALLRAVAHSMQDDQVLQRKNLPERIMRVLSRQEPSNTGESGQTQP